MAKPARFGEFVLGRPRLIALTWQAMVLAHELNALTGLVEQAIERLLPPGSEPSARLHTAMRYSLQAGGKRLRPVLVLAAARQLSRPGSADATAAAVAVECVHTYSLIHDDLPCMDNDDLRRGRPTAHKAFDEATALLAGDALLTHAFLILSESYQDSPALAHGLVRILADAAGSRRLVGGQMEDLLAEKQGATSEALEYIHLNKTAAMIEASLRMGGLCAGAGPGELAILGKAGRELGLAFQIVDDVLDATADTATLGKTAGKDARAGKATYVTVHGLEAARALAAERSDRAVSLLRSLEGDSAFLVALAESLLFRAH